MNLSIKSVLAVCLASASIAVAHAGNQVWLTSYAQAMKLSAKTGKPVLANFTGSDWCIFCKKLEGEVFSKPEFKQWADNRVILLRLDFPQNHTLSADQTKQNSELLHKYNVKGFPTIMFLNATGKAFGMYGYDRGGPQHWTTMADRLVGPHAAAMHQTSGTRSLKMVTSSSGYPPYISKTLYADNDVRGKKAPKWSVDKWLTGNAPQTEGKVILVDLWATWCPSCVGLIPDMSAWQKKFGKDLVVIGISEENSALVQKFIKSHKMSYNVAVDSHATLTKALGVQAIPQALVITPDHVVRWQGFPGNNQDPLTDEVLSRIIETSKKQTVADRN